jgi:hypothetical protein
MHPHPFPSQHALLSAVESNHPVLFHTKRKRGRHDSRKNATQSAGPSPHQAEARQTPQQDAGAGKYIVLYTSSVRTLLTLRHQVERRKAVSLSLVHFHFHFPWPLSASRSLSLPHRLEPRAISQAPLVSHKAFQALQTMESYKLTYITEACRPRRRPRRALLVLVLGDHFCCLAPPGSFAGAGPRPAILAASSCVRAGFFFFCRRLLSPPSPVTRREPPPWSSRPPPPPSPWPGPSSPAPPLPRRRRRRNRSNICILYQDAAVPVDSTST